MDPSGLKCVGPAKGISIRRIDIDWGGIFTNAEDKDWGHWWIEMMGGKDGTGMGKSYSYGWWPKNQVPALQVATGVPGELNGMYDRGTGVKIGTWDEDHDTHEGDKSGKVFAAKIVHDRLKIKRLKYGSGERRRCCTLDPDAIADRILIADCVIGAATYFAEKGSIWRFPGLWNCHSFQRWLLDQCCICKPNLFTKADKDYDNDETDNNETVPVKT